jgi:hypothetical protein
MPIASIDLRCRDGFVRLSFDPHLSTERLLALREQLADLDFEELSKRLQVVAAEWQVEVDFQLLAQ